MVLNLRMVLGPYKDGPYKTILCVVQQDFRPPPFYWNPQSPSCQIHFSVSN